MSDVLHIRCGQDIRETLRLAGIAGDFAEWGDPICEGPAPAGLPESQYEAARAEFMSTHWGVSPVEIHLRFAEQRRVVARMGDYKEVWLWFEHDLYDQCILVQLLAAIKAAAVDLSRLRLICVGSFPEIRRFVGLGQLTPEQLVTLVPQARPVTNADLELGCAARDALVAATPRGLEALLAPGATGDLQFLGAALRRHLQELPSIHCGLSLTQLLVLQTIEAGATTAIEVFHHLLAERDPQPYLGDTMFWAHLTLLAGVQTPAIAIDGEFPDQPVRLLSFGRDLLAGRADFCHANPPAPRALNRWRGGIEQRPEAKSVWRWHDTTDVAVHTQR